MNLYGSLLQVTKKLVGDKRIICRKIKKFGAQQRFGCWHTLWSEVGSEDFFSGGLVVRRDTGMKYGNVMLWYMRGTQLLTSSSYHYPDYNENSTRLILMLFRREVYAGLPWILVGRLGADLVAHLFRTLFVKPR